MYTILSKLEHIERRIDRTSYRGIGDVKDLSTSIVRKGTDRKLYFADGVVTTPIVAMSNIDDSMVNMPLQVAHSPRIYIGEESFVTMNEGPLIVLHTIDASMVGKQLSVTQSGTIYIHQVPSEGEPFLAMGSQFRRH